MPDLLEPANLTQEIQQYVELSQVEFPIAPKALYQSISRASCCYVNWVIVVRVEAV